MKKFIIILISFLIAGFVFGQNLQLRGAIDVWNNGSSTITMLDDFFYSLAPGDVIKITITGSANIAPYDEEREGGGFLGLFKKHYTVRIDNWLYANQVKMKFVLRSTANISNPPEIEVTPLLADDPNKGLTAEFTIPFDDSKPEEELLTTFRVKAWINQYMSPLRAGKYDVSVQVDSKTRVDKLKAYFSNPDLKPQSLPVLSFQDDIKSFVENGKLIYRYPNETVDAVITSLKDKPNIDAVKKDLFKYLLDFAPDNTTVRAGLADVYLQELNFQEAQLTAQKTIALLTKKNVDNGGLTDQDNIDFGSAYTTLANVNELKQLGLQENAYSIGAVFYGQAAEYYKTAKAMDEYSKSIMKEVRCLQKVGSLVSLKEAASILQEYNGQIEH